MGRWKVDISDTEFLKNSIFTNEFPINDFWYSLPRKHKRKLGQK